ncbi:restriction endonuclease subunit S [Nocardia farcinica]|uniref:restriction endonuclease subunit S n=1 Tax=Nocardia farcinica TaxID=37329 RepID=UPI0009E804DF|nr:restriction endonuclease subunit S [Nocardia farcinica]AXK84772.1 hypothetical protein DXT66_03170 [Nocardia farcinica]MBA4854456.1 restriction endonuclease subunit S [Nocardia farcinica]MBC9814641.1 restriction endonuclease subunit S [Nocardia farcinica]
MYLGLEHIEPGGRLLDPHLITAGDVASAKFAFEPGDILYGKLRPYLAKIAIPDFSGVCSTDIIPVRVTDVMDARFLLHYLRQPRLVDWANSRSAGANLPRLSPKVLAALPVPVPPLVEQRRIATILDHADALRAKRREALARLDELTQSIFIDMFGTLSANDMDWPTVEFESVMLEGPQNGLYKPSSEYGSGARILRIDGFHNGVPIKPDSLKRVRVDGAEEKKYALHMNDIIINRVNSIEHLGKSAIVPALDQVVVFESNMMRITLNEDLISPTFCLAQLQSSYLRGQIVLAAKDAVNQSSINQTDVKSFQLRLPPLERQQDYASRVGRLGEISRLHRTALGELDALFASLQSRAFRGEL